MYYLQYMTYATYEVSPLILMTTSAAIAFSSSLHFIAWPTYTKTS